MRYIIFILIAFVSGCAVAPLETTKILAIPQNQSHVGSTITIGRITDNRFPFWPRKEAHPPTADKGRTQDFEPIAAIKEVRLPMGEVRSSLSSVLKYSKVFKEIINPPEMAMGKNISEMLKSAIETSDYLIVGEVNSFYTKNIGLNKLVHYTVPFDFTFLGLPNIVAYLLSNGKFLILSGGLVSVMTAECVFSISLTVYSTETGHPITTIKVREIARVPVDAFAAYGELSNEEDDWVDVGRRLGEVALHNASVKAIKQIAEVIKKDIAKKNVN